MHLTDQQFRLICPTLPSARRAALLAHLNAAMERFGITSKFRVAAFISNLLHESRGLTHFVESLNYSAPRLRAVWPKRFPTLASAHPYAHNERALAAKVYGGRMGNVTAADAFNFRGHGGIQRTGRKAYERAEAALGIPCISQPDLLAQPQYAFLSDALFWSDSRLNQLADCLTGRRNASEMKTLTAICKRINGGTNGLAERVVFYRRTLAVLEQAPSAAVAGAHLDQAIAQNPLIPTPETHSQKKIDAESARPSSRVAAEEVKEQSHATSLIDVAEATPASMMKATATSIWSRTGGRVVQLLGVVYAALQAGSFVAWGGAAVVVIALVVLLYVNRRDLRRWANVGAHKLKEAVAGA